MRKSAFQPRPTLLLALVTMTSGLVPDIYLIPSRAWIDDDQSVFVSHDYGDGMKSRPEWGLTLSGKAVQRLEASYRFDRSGRAELPRRSRLRTPR